MNNRNTHIKVSYDSDVFGSGVFWDDHCDYIEDIPNIPARTAAERALETGKEQKFGMWAATPYQKADGE